MLLTVPNVSEGADTAIIVDELIAATRPLTLLDLHSDPDHGRSVLSLAGPQGEIAPALARLAAAAARLIDITAHGGSHPHVGLARRRAGRLPRSRRPRRRVRGGARPRAR